MEKATSSLLTLFARYEPTTDSVALAHQVKGKRDVCLYKDEAATQLQGRYPWYMSGKPTRASKTCMLNCYRWRLVWLEDLAG